MADRLAYSLVKLRDQVAAAYPGRDTSNDGWIASAAHHQQNPSSDHEADSRGIVHAVDFTHDPAHGFNSYDFADFLIAKRDPRIKYVISNRRIAGDPGYAERNGRRAWTWYKYNGANPHTEHVHVSCNRASEDDARPWDMPGAVVDPSPPGEFFAEGSGRGSWFSQFDGQYKWRDPGDKPNSNALGVPDSQQGFAMYDRATLGTWRDVRAPNGVVLRLQQTDIGPHPNTERKIDIAAAAAEHFGYTPHNFPTDGEFEWSAVVLPPGRTAQRGTYNDPAVEYLQRLLGFDPKNVDGDFGPLTEEAVKRFQRRTGLVVTGRLGADDDTWDALEKTYAGPPISS